MTERENMLSGLLYDPTDPELSHQRDVARNLAAAFNRTTEEEKETRQKILKQLWAHWESGRSCIPMCNLTMAATPTWGTGAT